jgi:hypothetical protein
MELKKICPDIEILIQQYIFARNFWFRNILRLKFLLYVSSLILVTSNGWNWNKLLRSSLEWFRSLVKVWGAWGPYFHAVPVFCCITFFKGGPADPSILQWFLSLLDSCPLNIEVTLREALCTYCTVKNFYFILFYFKQMNGNSL